MIDLTALDAAFGRARAQILAMLGERDLIAELSEALRGAQTLMMVSAYATRMRTTVATVAADNGSELEAALEVLGLIALRVWVMTADALHSNRRTVAAITDVGGDCCLALKASQASLLSDAGSYFGKV